MTHTFDKMVSLMVAAAMVGAACASPFLPPAGSDSQGVCLMSNGAGSCSCCPGEAATMSCCEKHGGTTTHGHTQSNTDSRPVPLEQSADCSCCLIASTSVVIAPPMQQQTLIIQPASTAVLNGDITLRGFDYRDTLLRPPIS